MAVPAAEGDAFGVVRGRPSRHCSQLGRNPPSRAGKAVWKSEGPALDARLATQHGRRLAGSGLMRGRKRYWGPPLKLQQRMSPRSHPSQARRPSRHRPVVAVRPCRSSPAGSRRTRPNRRTHRGSRRAASPGRGRKSAGTAAGRPARRRRAPASSGNCHMCAGTCAERNCTNLATFDDGRDMPQTGDNATWHGRSDLPGKRGLS